MSMILYTFVFIDGTPVVENKVEVVNKNCFFEKGATSPTFLTDIGGGKLVNISCTDANCNCVDGKGTGYAGCHSCCCGIRKRCEACKITEKVVTVKEEETTYSKLSISLAVILLVVTIAAVIFIYKLKQDNNKLNVENASLRGTPNNTPQQSVQGTPQVNNRGNQYYHSQQQQQSTVNSQLSPPTNIEAAAEFSASAPFISRIENPTLVRVRNAHSQGSTRSNTPTFDMSANNPPEDVQPIPPTIPIDMLNDVLDQPHNAVFGVTEMAEQNMNENAGGVIEENRL